MRQILSVLDLPPVWLIAHVAAVSALAQASPTVFGAFGDALGPALLALGVGVMLVAVWQMAQHRTTVIPRRNPSSLVTTGVFAWSRNPIYLGNTIAMTGAALAFANPWFLPAALIAALAVTRLAIQREEAHLAARFGAAWDTYSQRTARWFGR